jgi:glutamate synthase (NADPH/NADH) small chain
LETTKTLTKSKRLPEINTIIKKETLAEKIDRYLIYAPHIAAKAQPGQFVIVRLSENGERVPLTICDSDIQNGTITLVVQTVGKSTAMMAAMQNGERINDILGPLGNASEIKNFGNVVVVGGGLGAAVSFPVAKALKAAGNHVTSIVGARSKDLLILEEEIRAISDELYITTDDGSYGFHGFVTNKLQDLINEGHHYDRAIAIGPLPMMRAITQVTRPYNIPTIVSLNTIMVDGTGMCGGCRVIVGGKIRFTCVEGPEFDGHAVDFDTIIYRNRAYNHDEDCRLDTAIQELEKSEPEPIHLAGEKERQIMPELPIETRVHNFEEVALGFTPEQALAEANRCLDCRVPKCVEGCPVSVKIPDFIRLLKAGDPLAAGKLIKEDNSLPRVCGRVCPQADQCEGSCVLGRRGKPIAIGSLERYVSDYLANHGNDNEFKKLSHELSPVAIVGSGPASLSCAGDLVRAGYPVTVFEAFHDFGGVLRYGIPEFRLPKTIVSNEVETLAKMGVDFKANILIGATHTIDDLLNNMGFKAVFIGSGAGLPRFLNIPGESMIGIYTANEFLTRVNLMKAYTYPKVDTPILNMHDKTVAVFGGGNTALDSARVSLRLGAKKVYIIYRRSEEELPGRKEEIEHAMAEGVEFTFLRNPQEFYGNEQGWLTGVRLVKMELGEPDKSGRRSPKPIEGSDYILPIDRAIVAIGNGSNPIIQKTTPGLDVNLHGHITVNPDTMESSIPGVFAGGDIVTGGATVIMAMGAGRKAAKSIMNFLNKGSEV